MNCLNCPTKNRSITPFLPVRRATVLFVWGVLSGLTAVPVWAADDSGGAEAEPLLRLDTGGPSSFVSSLTFDRESQTLYAGGFDKVVRAWTLRGDRFESDNAKTLRVPVGPGLAGAINAIALSPDGKVLAVAGRGVVEGESGFRHTGRILPALGAMTKQRHLDDGMIYLVDTQTHAAQVLRGHRGPVLALAFAPDREGTPVLASAAQEAMPQSSVRRAVVRLWDGRTRKQLRSTFVELDTSSGLSPENPIVQLAVRRVGLDPSEVHVAIAWSDGRFRIWDPSSGPVGKLRPSAGAPSNEGRMNSSVTWIPGDPRWLTGSLQRLDGQLRFWQVDANGDPRATGRPLALTSRNRRHFVPRAVAVLPHGEGQLAAVASLSLSLVSVPGGGSELRPAGLELQLIDLQRQRQVFARELRPLSESLGVPQPRLAASADGQFLAISGGPHHEIWVLKVSELLRQQFRPQRLQSQSAQVAEAHFVRRGQQRGIFLKEQQADGTSTPYVYDFDAGVLRRLEAGGDWQYDRSRTKNWELSPQRSERGTQRRISLAVRRPDGQAVTIRLPEDQEEITSQAIGATGPAQDLSLVAVASHSLGEPLLSLHRLDTGDPVRQFRGHTERIRSLSFTADGRLLVSVADDQTVCVWSLTDLDTVLGKHGALTGVAVDDSDSDGPVVVRIDPDSPSRQVLSVGDRLTGYLDGGEFRPWSSAWDFYDRWWLTSPGASLSVRRLRGTQDPQDVALQAGQGVDERKPLFSFFLARSADGRPRQWIGWSPLGPFESSDERVERFLGWHFNTGDRQRPTAFADLNQYRDRYFRRGLLKDLVTHGALLASREPDPLSRPDMSLWIPEAGLKPEMSDGQLLLRQLQTVTVALDIDFDFPSKQVQQVQCRMDGEVIGNMRPTSGPRWEIDLSQQDWSRGVHRIEAVVRTRERRPQEFVADLQVRYQPPAPEIRFALPELTDLRGTTVEEEQFQLDAEILANVAGEPIDVRLYQLRDHQRQEIERWELAQGGTISKNIDLRTGPNHLQLEARNTRALSDYLVYETNSRSLTITKVEKEKPLVPPKIILRVVEPRLAEAELQFGQLLVTPSARLALRGSIVSEDELEEATIQIGRDGLPRRLANLTASSQAAGFDFQEVLDGLTPETTDVLLFVRTRRGATAELFWQVTYAPPLPELEVVAPTTQERVLLLTEEPVTKQVITRLRFPKGLEIPPAILQQLRAAVEIDATETQPAQIDISQRTLTATIPLTLGDHKIRLRVNYEWNPNYVHRSDPILMTCLAEPRITKKELLQQAGISAADLVFEGKVDGGISRIHVGERELSPESWSVDDASGAVKIRATIDVAPGDDVAIHVAGVAKPYRFPVPAPRLVQRRQPPPEVEFLSPSRDTNTQQRELSVRFAVRSASPMSQVQLRQNRVPVYTIEGVELQRLLTEQQGQFMLEQTVALKLKEDSNSLDLIAENTEGLAKRSLTVNVPPAPIRVVVDSLRTSDGDVVSFGDQTVDDPVVSAVGRVIYRDRDDPRTQQRQVAKIWVNGFLQTYEELPAARDGLQREFEVPVILSRRTSLLEIELPGLERDIRDELRYEIRCTKPLQDQRLHLLVIGVGKGLDEEALIQGALKTLEARRDPADRNSFSTPIFTRGIIYGPLTAENVDQQTVRAELFEISRQIEIRKRQLNATGQDLVIIYYTGGELIANERQFYLTTEPDQDVEDLPHYGIASEELKAFVEKTLGAHLLLLDVSRSCDKYCEAQTWPATSHGAMLRFAWLNPKQNMPEQARLISALQQLDPQSNELSEVDQQLTEHLKSLKQIYANTLAYDRHVPDSLGKLLLRSGPEDE